MLTPSTPNPNEPSAGDPTLELLGGDAARLRRVLARRRRPNGRVPSWGPRGRSSGAPS